MICDTCGEQIAGRSTHHEVVTHCDSCEADCLACYEAECFRDWRQSGDDARRYVDRFMEKYGDLTVG